MLERQFINKLKQEQHIIIYGAGMVGGLVYKRLVSHGMSDKVLCFAVTKKSNQKTYLGVMLCQIDEVIQYNKKSAVVVATLPGFHDEIKALLLKYSFQNIILTKSILYNSLCKNYINEFLKKKKDREDVVDVILMASDNNSSSGAFLCLADLGYELNRCGVKCKVILSEYGDGERILIDRGVDYTYIPSEHWCIYKKEKKVSKIWKLWKNHKAIRKLQEYFHRHAVKLIHNNTTYTYVGAIAALREKLPVVWHLRENIWDQGYSFMNEQRAVGLINQSSGIIAISNYMAGSIKEIDQRKLKIIYDGVEIKKFYSKRPILNNSNQVIIMLAGTIIEHKRQEELIEAAVILKERLAVNFEIRLIGKEEGNYIKRLRNIVSQYQLQDIVYFMGKRDNVEDFFREADIAVVCSKAEPFGRVTVEAQLSGCLVIGADSGATVELIQDEQTGLLYHAGSAEDLAARIIQAVENPQNMREIARAGQEHARKTFSKENNANEVIKVYRKIMESEGAN